MKNLPESMKDAFRFLLGKVNNDISNNGCNDFRVENTPEMFLAIEMAGARNVNMTLEEFRKSDEYDDYKPRVSKDKSSILTEDFTILLIIEHELGLNDD